VTLVAGVLGAGLFTPAGAATGQKVDFGYTGAIQSWTVPDGVHSVRVDLIGGAGGDGNNPSTCAGTGGAAGWVDVAVPVNPGDTLDLWVADGGHLNGAGGAGISGDLMQGGAGGGAGSGASENGGGGGGASAIWLGSTHTDDHLLAVAGGGGGGGGKGGVDTMCGGHGRNGGWPATDGRTAFASLGTGGTGGTSDQVDQTSHHHAGWRGGVSRNTTGTLDPAPVGGGGGGGGAGLSHCEPTLTGGLCYGVGAGGGPGGADGLGEGGGGGAAGSSYLASGLTNPFVSGAGAHGSDGTISLTYGQRTSTELSSSAVVASPGVPVTLRALVDGSDGGGTVRFSSDGTVIDGCSAVPFISGGGTAWLAGCTTSTLTSGRHTISAVYSGDAASAGSFTYGYETISRPSVTRVTGLDSPVTAGSAVGLTAVVDTGAASGSVAFTMDGTDLPGCTSVPITDGDGTLHATCKVTAPAAGTHPVVASYSGATTDLPSSGTANLTVGTPRTPVSVTTSGQLPDARVGRAYSTRLAATGGTAPYSWTTTDGALPAGLRLSGDGNLSGTPVADGSTTFTAQATDSTGQAATRTFSLSVARAPADLAVTVAHGAFRHGSTGRYTVTVTNKGGVAAPSGTTVSTRLPMGLTQPSASGTGWVCRTDVQPVSCTRGSGLAAGASTTLTVSSRVAAATGALLTTDWGVTPTDGAPGDNAATDQVRVVR
jgi:uncharacterized repeat protein (TIGR01451 family)